ncbi:glycoside hydrolase domain-containing protein [Paenibacillus sp. S150]|uniref:glycoside hydrolase domain-containing protein n=1 Tax=Paenibacillus sp. S150 TaxID=2749826 RepID=UPI001C59E45B|nr:glycoside hydrolase domain-containing protein [Paenibacillus sp. S150]MBW4080276.1 DUF1906 domain-containing protein [Paenibacillus sp. S150]
MNKALIIVLQAIEGLSPSSASGNFGDTTKALCPIMPDTENKLTAQQEADAIDLLKYALCCNGYSINLSNSIWDTLLVDTIKTFQSDMLLPVTGDADLNTWMALLLSKGNPDRSSTACDTRFEMTTDRLLQLKNNGYQIVGRYLTGTDFKVLRATEPQRILNNGIHFFPIFQESGTDITYFTKERGEADAKKAVRAARNFNIPEGTVIFFATDLDPQNTEISAYILPYFKSLYENMDTAYLVGVYGTRNVCTKVNDAGYAVTSFVSDMSTGYSGNMGFKMPENWTYDQFSEIPMSPDWAIDKDAYSGKFPPVTALNIDIYQKPIKPTTIGKETIVSLLEKIRDLELLYEAYYDMIQEASGGFIPIDAVTAALGITNFLRSEKYGGTQWAITTLRPINNLFIQYVKDNNLDLYNYFLPYINSNSNDLSDGLDGLLDFAHLAATTEGYISTPLVPDFWTGWGADLATAMAAATTAQTDNPNESIQDIADSLIGDENSPFNYSDICSDADAIKIASLVRSPNVTTHSFSNALETYYISHVQDRYLHLVKDIDTAENLTALKKDIYRRMTSVLERDPFVGLLHLKGGDPSGEVIRACCNSFAQYIYSELD